jgi:hypothetical protein
MQLYQQIIDELLIQAVRSNNDEKDFCEIIYKVADLDSSLSVDVDKILKKQLGITQKDRKPQLSSVHYMKSFYYKREGIIEPKDEKKKKFDANALEYDLHELSSETAISGFNDMSQNIKDAQRIAEQEQTMEDSIWGKDDEGWGVDDDW